MLTLTAPLLMLVAEAWPCPETSWLVSLKIFLEIFKKCPLACPMLTVESKQMIFDCRE